MPARTNPLTFAAIAALLIAFGPERASAYSKNDDAKTVTCDGTLADTQAGWNYAVGKNQDGWVVRTGAAGQTYNWSSGTLSLASSRPITFAGGSATNRPKIVFTGNSGGFGIYIHTQNGKTITVRDFKFAESPFANALIYVGGWGEDNFRFTNIEFGANIPGRALWISSPGDGGGPGPYGLIDHCDLASDGALFFLRDNAAAVPNSWHRPMSFGTKKAVYVEDCTFTWKGWSGILGYLTDGDNGARFVVRHSTMRDMGIGTHGADSQPLEGGKNPNRSFLQAEVMHNTFTITDTRDTIMLLRGGTAVIFDNTVNRIPQNAALNTFVKTAFYRATANNGVCPVDRVYPADYIGTQQPGSGVIGNGTTGANQDPKYPNEPWGSVPIYLWNNRVNVPLTYGEVGSSEFVQPNRDYFNGTEKPGYREFTYPHPLQTGGPTAGPSPAENVRIVPRP
jgi:hypothetical protein